MGFSVLFVLTRSERIVRDLRGRAGPLRVRVVSCLKQIAVTPPDTWLVVDPRAIRTCCLQRLARLRKGGRLAKVFYLPCVAPPKVLLDLPRAHPGRVADSRRLSATFGGPARAASPRLAWEEQGNILETIPDDARARRFMAMAHEGALRGVGLPSVARTLGISVRTLSRLAWRWFGQPPSVILRLTRVRLLASDLAASNMSLCVMARRYGYSSRQALNREFRAYVGLTPSAYRLQAEADLWRKSVPEDVLGITGTGAQAAG